MEMEFMDYWKRVLTIRSDVVARHIAGEELLIPIRGRLADMQRIFALDPVAAHVWKKLDGSVDLDVVLQSVLATFDVPEERARKDVKAFVGQLEAEGLVTDLCNS